MKKILEFLKKNLVFIFLIVVVGILGCGFNLINKTQKQLKKTEEEIKAKYEEKKKYETQKDLAPSPELINKLKKEQEFVQNQFISMLNRFTTTTIVMPEFKDFPNVEFKEFLFETNDILKKKAQKNNVVIPSSFGFQETGFPSQDQIPLFTLQITVLKHIIDLLIDSGVSVVNAVVPGMPSSVSFYKVLPLDISITGSSIEIMRFLKYLNNPSSFFTLESFSITKKDSGMFQGNFKINAVIIDKNAVAQAPTVSVKQPTPVNGAPVQPTQPGAPPPVQNR
ncbi:MAG TPA: Amuc_1100 family pilus-like protein [Candidatus Ratteibacteria bacterium]|nr:Amuc_1100 family pilus-like protein [bacterium]HPC29674.1 Amuc_1100 family pilus-like protein [bacterium]HRS06994.1 Amuc_1100 family pilus-like protein [Candidatus Ratteibacteria bacterium]HRV04319.1 Amuc_1100 family pilus-like protein [Candidatus Ratteibacteria bacterium]